MADVDKIYRPETNRELLDLLEANGLTLPEAADDNVGLYNDGRLVGCGFLKGNMFQGVAIDASLRGEGLSATLVTELIRKAVERGFTSWQVITKPDMAHFFMGLGFRHVADARPYAVFLEAGSASVAASMEELHRQAEGRPEPRASIVMNANPFTLGHRHLVERAAAENPWVWVLAVQEERSEFPFDLRLQLIREGTADLPNVEVIPGGEYVISARTFPAYFTRQESLASAQGAMDAAVFAERVGPALGVTRRYVGTEPLSPSTARYNEALLERLPKAGIQVVVMDRATTPEGEVISASRVRQCLAAGDWDAVRAMTPETTYRRLRGEGREGA